MVKRASVPILLAWDRNPARCGACGENREFRTDRNGRVLEQCGCGYRTYVKPPGGKRNEPRQH